MQPPPCEGTLATPASAGASWMDIAREVEMEMARERRDLAERVVQNAAYLLVVVPALVVLGLVTVMLGLVALGAVVAVLVQLPWTVTAFFALVVAGLLAAYRGSEPRIADPFGPPPDGKRCDCLQHR